MSLISVLMIDFRPSNKISASKSSSNLRVMSYTALHKTDLISNHSLFLLVIAKFPLIEKIALVANLASRDVIVLSLPIQPEQKDYSQGEDYENTKCCVGHSTGLTCKIGA